MVLRVVLAALAIIQFVSMNGCALLVTLLLPLAY